MNNSLARSVLALSLCGAAGAWTGALTTLGLTSGDLESQVLRSTRNVDAPLSMPGLTTSSRKAAKALSPEQRADAVREIGGLLKTLVMSDAFQQAHAAYIKGEHKAVDHGIKVKTMDEKMAEMMKPKPGQDPAAEMTRQIAVQMATQFRELPIDNLKQMFPDDLATWTRQATRATGTEKAKKTKMAARAKEIQPWIQSNPEEFRKAYSVLKSADLGGPETEEELTSSGNREAMEAEQLKWNESNLKGLLKRKLAAFVAEAASVDFTAQTTTQGNRIVFANTVYEKKSEMWKAMYRAGKAPTGAAAELARAWLKEL